MTEEKLRAFVEYVTYVKYVRDQYPPMTDEELNVQIADILKRPPVQIEGFTRQALRFLRLYEEGQ